MRGRAACVRRASSARDARWEAMSRHVAAEDNRSTRLPVTGLCFCPDRGCSGRTRRGGTRAEETRVGSTTSTSVPGRTARDEREVMRPRSRADQGSRARSPTDPQQRCSHGNADLPNKRDRRDVVRETHSTGGIVFARFGFARREPRRAPTSEHGSFFTSRRPSVRLLLFPHSAGLLHGLDGGGGLERGLRCLFHGLHHRGLRHCGLRGGGLDDSLG